MLVSPPPESSLTAEQLAQAEALIASHLGVASLEREEGVGESGTVGSSGLIALRRPAVSVQSLTLGGAPAAGVLASPYMLDVGSLAGMGYSHAWGGAPARIRYTVEYTAGWTAEDLPAALQAAVLTVAEGVAAAAGRVGLKSQSMGPVSQTYTDAGALSPDVLTLLRPWLPLRV